MNICFDCDDTLYDLQEPFRKTMETFFPSFETDHDLDTAYRQYRTYGDEVFALQDRGIISVDESGMIRLWRLCETYGLPVPDLKKAQAEYRANQGRISLSPVMTHWFAHTKSNLAILTNGPDKHQRKKLKALDMDRFVKHEWQFTSEQIGHAKPEREAFEYVIQNTNTIDWIYVGDSYHHDMEGAKQAGWKTIHFNRHRRTSGPMADWEVFDERALVELLERLEKEEAACLSCRPNTQN
jgi:putative hydrolase of the HAD superfamily